MNTAPGRSSRTEVTAILGAVLVFLVSFVLLFEVALSERVDVRCGTERCEVRRGGGVGSLHLIGAYPLGALGRAFAACGTHYNGDAITTSCAPTIIVGGWVDIGPDGRVTRPDVPRTLVELTERPQSGWDGSALEAAQVPGGHYTHAFRLLPVPGWLSLTGLVACPVLGVVLVRRAHAAIRARTRPAVATPVPVPVLNE